MKKTLLALSTVALAVNAMAAATNTTVTSQRKSSLDKIWANTSVSYMQEIQKKNISQAETSSLQYLTIKNKISNDFAAKLQIRTEKKGDQAAEETQMLNPRITLSGMSTSIKTAAGDIAVNPQLRIEPNINNTDDAIASKTLGTLRAGVSLSMDTNNYNSASIFLAKYEKVAQANASTAVKEQSYLYFIFSDAYQFADAQAISLTYEVFTDLNQNTGRITNIESEGGITLTYSNSMISNLSIDPYLNHNPYVKAATNNLALGVDMTYQF